MNDNLKEIARAAQLEHCVSHTRLQEFAHLIVNRVINLYNDDGHQTDYEQDLKILQHFGIDE